VVAPKAIEPQRPTILRPSISGNWSNDELFRGYRQLNSSRNGYDRFLRDSRPSSMLFGKFCSNQPVALDEPDARSSPTRPCGISIGVGGHYL